MSSSHDITSDLLIRIDGAELSSAIRPQLLEVAVDQHISLPGMFTIRLHDPDLMLLDDGYFELTKRIEIAARTVSGTAVTLLDGEITAIEPEFSEGMVAELVVRGFDRLHRLYRETKSKTYLNVKDSDLAIEFADRAGLQADVQTTQTVYDHLFQYNQPDLHFLMERAWRIGYECFADEKQFVFRKPAINGDGIQLKWGEDLQTFHPRMTLAEQVEEVQVKGWDVAKKAGIVGEAEDGQLYPRVAGRNGADWSQELSVPSKLVLVDHSVVSQAEADIVAAARLDELSGVFIDAQGTAFRRPEIRAGRAVELSALGKRFSGTYWVTSVTHTYTHTGLVTTFSARGTRTGLLSSEIRGESGGFRARRQSGVVPAIVTNTDDPNNWGRVKVKYPWLADDEESDWVRITGPGAGMQRGLCAIPAVDDEVLVAFIHGDFNQPVVLGGLWNGQDELPAAVSGAAEGEKSKVRTWHSQEGHMLAMYDNEKNKIIIVSQGDIDIEAKGTINMKAETINLN